MARINIHYDKFMGTSRKDAEVYLKEFEASAALNGQSAPADKASIFVGLMKKNAQRWYD